MYQQRRLTCHPVVYWLIDLFFPLATNHTQRLQLQPWEDTPHPFGRSHETHSDSPSLLPGICSPLFKRESSFLLLPQKSFLVILDFSDICLHHPFLSSDVRHVIPLENWTWVWGVGCIPLVRQPEGFKVSLYQWCPPGICSSADRGAHQFFPL